MIEVMYTCFVGTVCARCGRRQKNALLFNVKEQWVCVDCLEELVEIDEEVAREVIDAFDFPCDDPDAVIPAHLKKLSLELSD